MNSIDAAGTAPTWLRHRYVPTLLLVVAVLYGLAVNDHWSVKPDGALYLSLGRSLAEGRGMEYNGRQFWGIPPAVPALVAGCRLATGGDGYWLLNALFSAMAVATAALAYGIARRLAAERPEAERQALAVGSLLVVGLSARMFCDATLILTDVPFTMLVAAGLYAMLRGRDGHWGWYLAAGAALSLSAWVRLLGLLVGAVMIAALLLDFRRGQGGYLRRLAGAAVVAALLAGSVALWLVALRNRADAGTPDYLAAADSALTGSAGGWENTVVEGLLRVPPSLAGILTDQRAPWVNLVPTALVALGLVVTVARRQWLAALPVLGYVAFLVLWGSGAVAARYLLPMLPLVAYLLLVGTAAVVETFSRAASADRPVPARLPRGALAALVAAGVCLVVSLPKDLRQIWWMRQPAFYEAFDKGRWQGLVEAAAHLRSRGRAGDAALTPDWTIMNYLSGLRVIEEPLEGRHTADDAHKIEPERFVRAAVDSAARFVVVRTSRPDAERAEWAHRVREGLAATEAFHRPPAVFADVAVFERTGGP